ncbi:Ig-like domain-containing protein, partial [Bosea sp. (in: a-proteobacteria)]|uniref:Ig-like domain-containing protein n=1 Tax=Bosea sp. (in: a-proteobacteria) TaxID=1871050 RepID=UPI001228B213
AEQLTPTAAWTNYYQGAPADVTYAWGTNRPWEIKETARALENDPQKIFAFVKNYIRFEPRFGAQKGAVGAIIDRSGTAFDQAQLLVELLRAAGFTASYQVGTLSLSGTDFVNWIGISDPTAAAQFLANGGIPAQVTGSGAISNVTMAHAWVTAQIGASSVVLDPSYKVMDRWSQIDVATESGLSPSAFVGAAATATGSGVENGVSYVTGVNLAGAKSQLDAAANLLLTKLRTTYKDWQSEEIAGGERIRLYADPWANKTTGTLSAIWGTYGSGLPDKYRTKVALVAGNCRASLFADEIYGRRLNLHTRVQVEDGDPTWTVKTQGYDAFGINGDPLPGETLVGYSSSGCMQVPASGGPLISIDLPYAARGPTGAYGTWMDRSTSKQFDPGEIEIVLGWGDAGSELQARLSDDFEASDPSNVTGSSPRMAGEYSGPPMNGAPAGPNGDAKLYASWLAQMSRASHFVEGVAQTRIQHHYTIGVVYSQVQRQVDDQDNDNWADPGEQIIAGSVQDSATRIDMDSGYSTTSLTGSAANKLAARHLIAALGATLEGSVFEQQMDAVDTDSTAQRFPWGQESTETLTTIRYHKLLPGSLAPQDYRRGGAPEHGAACKGLAMANLGVGNLGYTVIEPNDRYLGPGTTREWIGPQNGIFPYVNRAPESDMNMQRGCAWIAFNADASEIAHIVTSVDREMKGAGGPSKKDTDGRAAPTQADLLKDVFKDRSNIEGVDLRTGAFTYKPEPDLVLGQGEFPYSLSFQRVYQAGGATCPKCAPGWTHNLDIRAIYSGGGLEGMGQTTPLALAAPLVGLKAAFELYKADPTSLGDQLAAMGVMRWISEHLTYNVVTVSQGASAETFVRLADGTFAPPPGSQSSLTQMGERHKVESNRHGRSPIWLYDPIVLTRTSGAGDKIQFKWIEYNPSEIVPNDYGSVMGFAQGFFADTWTFPQGVSLTFSYCTDPPITYGGEPGISQVISPSLPCADRLKKVDSNLGLWLEIDRLNATSSDGRSTFVTYRADGGEGSVSGSVNYQDVFSPMVRGVYAATGFINVSGKRRAYQWELPPLSGRPSSALRLKRVLSPTDYTGGVVARDDYVNVPTAAATAINPLTNDLPLSGLRIAGITTPQHGTAQRNQTSITYTRAAGYLGADNFKYTAQDLDGASQQATIYVLAADGTGEPPPVNHAPVATDNTYTYDGVSAIYDPIADDYDPDPNDHVSYVNSAIPAAFGLWVDNKLLYKDLSPTGGSARSYPY